MRRRPPRSEDEFRPFAAVSGSHPLRPLALWLWNDRLDPHEVRRQVRLLSEAGFGAIVIRPGEGLVTPFLSDGWLDAVEAAIDEARRVDLQIILHDGGRAFPTPGRSRWLEPQFQRKTLRYEILDELEPDREFVARPESLALFSAASTDAGLADFQRLPLPAESSGPDALEAAASSGPDALEAAASSGSDAPGGFGVSSVLPSTADSGAAGAGAADVGAADVGVGNEKKSASVTAGRLRVHFFWEASGGLDPLDPAAVRAFLDSAYELCYREFGSEYAHCIVGMAAELPDFEAPPWSPALVLPALSLSAPSLPALSLSGEETPGRDVLDLLPAVLLGAQSQEAQARCGDRHDYWRIVNQAYIRAFSSQLQQWCGNRDILLLAEGEGGASLSAQMHQNAGLIPVLSGASVPAAGFSYPSPSDGDALKADVVAIKSAVSAARHAASRAGSRGSSRAISLSLRRPCADSLQGSAWWMAAVQAALGAGSLQMGPFLYSSAGDRKRETPAALAVTQPGSGDFPRLNAAIERLFGVMNAGHAVTELLVIHPLRSAWTNFMPDSSEPGSPGPLGSLDQSLADLAAGLAQCGRDFDFADESVLADRAAVVDDCLRIGENLYRAVVLPDAESLASTTVDLLGKFIDAGGVVVASGRIPAYEDGSPSERPAQVLGPAARSGADAASVIKAVTPANFRLALGPSPEAGVYCQHRDTGRRQFVLVANVSGTRPAPVHLTLRGQGRMELWDCETGELTPVIAEMDPYSVSVSLTVPGGGVALLAMD
ncbi:MAG: hypothetical protein LC772_10045, partial [Chloroflexi bacterium]|nr:hypothetical protein [Chloroflexota bacterium]